MSILIVNAYINIQKLFKNLTISLGTGILAAFCSGNVSLTYSQMKTPSFAPLGFIFPIIWTLLYTGLGISAYISEMKDAPCYTGLKNTTKLYYLQLIFSFMWPVLFFNFKMPLAALISLFILVLLTIAVGMNFLKQSKYTLIFTLPYLIWCVFLILLNIFML